MAVIIQKKEDDHFSQPTTSRPHEYKNHRTPGSWSSVHGNEKYNPERIYNENSCCHTFSIETRFRQMWIYNRNKYSNKKSNNCVKEDVKCNLKRHSSWNCKNKQCCDKFWTCLLYRVIINDYPIAEGVGGVVECAASLIAWVRLVSPMVAILAVVEICLLICITLRGWRHIQNLCGFSKPTAMGQSFIMTLYYEIVLL
jgi:hypothetical protein